eukprot:m.834098 g.834098  ORF g.834098 m.834098 type:complete len:71 (+) comp23443_c0_seq5:873-1085(+)
MYLRIRGGCVLPFGMHVAVYALSVDVSGDEMIANPGETKSDSFYFVNGKLIMHNKAEYSYNVGEGDGADS